jgi:hypothetical protein
MSEDEFLRFEEKEHEFLLYLTARWLPMLIRTQGLIIRALIDADPSLAGPLGKFLGSLQDLERDLDRRIGFLRSHLAQKIRMEFE